MSHLTTLQGIMMQGNTSICMCVYMMQPTAKEPTWLLNTTIQCVSEIDFSVTYHTAIKVRGL